MASANSPSAPAVPPPRGEHSQFVDPPTNDVGFIVMYIVFVVVSTPLIIIRMYTREFITRRVWWDDWTCLIGWAFFIALIGMQAYWLKIGGTAAMWNITKAQNRDFQEFFKKAEIIARVGIFFTKTSILLLLLRLFVPQGVRRTRSWWAIWLTFWWNLFYAIALILSILLDCVDDKFKKAQGKSCENQWAILISASIINVVTDAAILAIPMIAIRGLQMSRARKLKWSAAFAVGFAGVLASLARLIFQVIEAKTSTNEVLALVVLLALAEQFIGILVPCLAAIPAFWRHITRSAHSHQANVGEEEDKRSTKWTLTGRKGPGRRDGKRSDPYHGLISTTTNEESGTSGDFEMMRSSDKVNSVEIISRS